MRGHELVLDLRNRRRRPDRVSVLAMRANDGLFRYPDPAWPEVEIVPGENVQRLDLRFLVGLPVHVIGFDDDHIAHVAAACRAAGARPVDTFGSSNRLEPFHG